MKRRLSEENFNSNKGFLIHCNECTDTRVSLDTNPIITAYNTCVLFIRKKREHGSTHPTRAYTYHSIHIYGFFVNTNCRRHVLTQWEQYTSALHFTIYKYPLGHSPNLLNVWRKGRIYGHSGNRPSKSSMEIERFFLPINITTVFVILFKEPPNSWGTCVSGSTVSIPRNTKR